MKLIPLSQGYQAMVSDSDYEQVSQYKWSFLKSKTTPPGYAMRSVLIGHRDNNKPKNRRQIFKYILMHRFLLGASGKELVDHKDRNGLNNQRENIRIATKSQNGMNSKIRKDNLSGIKGISWDKIHKKWRARIKLNGKEINRTFDDIQEAIKFRENKAKELFGEYNR